jgi:class 3 adenylate cyclase
MTDAWLEDQSGSSVPLIGTVTLGRASKNTLKIESEQVSRRHALIHAQGGSEYWLVDLGSMNGTLCGGRRVTRPTLLRNGDLLEIAGHCFTFRIIRRNPTAIDPSRTTAPLKNAVTMSNFWLLLADIEKSSALSQALSTQDFAMVVGKWFMRTREVIEEQGGSINKYLGDGFFAHWEAQPDMPEKVFHALESFWKMRQKEDPLFRVVVHFGEVAVDPAGGINESSMLGADVHYLFRIEKLAGSAGWPFVVSARAAQELSGVCVCEPLGSRRLASFPGDHAFFAPRVDEQSQNIRARQG